MTLPASECAWAAGFFEADGTMRINKPTARNLGALLVSVVNTDRDVLEWFQQRWPGYLRRATGLRDDQRPAYLWVIAARRAARFLLAIQPYIVRTHVRARIEHCLWFQGQKRAGAGGVRGQAQFDYAEQQWNAYWWMCELNQRGRPALTSPATIAVARRRAASCPNAGSHRRRRS